MSKDGSKDNKKILPTNDLLFKKAFTSKGNENILLGFINDLIGENFSSVKIINPYNIDSFKQKDGESKKMQKTEVDILAEESDGSLVTIEMQLNNHKNFIERSEYYAANAFIKGYSDYQRMIEIGEEKNKYSSIRKVYGINILNFHLFDKDLDALMNFSLYNKKHDLYLKDIRDTKTMEMIYFSLKNKNVGQNLKYWQDFFSGIEVSDKAPEYIKEAEEIVDLQNLSEEEREMAQILSEQDIIRLEELEYSKDEGREEGREEGIEIGLDRGRKEGLTEGRKEVKESIVLHMHNMGKSIDDIIENTGFDEEFINDVIEKNSN